MAGEKDEMAGSSPTLEQPNPVEERTLDKGKDGILVTDLVRVPEMRWRLLSLTPFFFS